MWFELQDQRVNMQKVVTTRRFSQNIRGHPRHTQQGNKELSLTPHTVTSHINRHMPAKQGSPWRTAQQTQLPWTLGCRTAQPGTANHPGTTTHPCIPPCPLAACLVPPSTHIAHLLSLESSGAPVHPQLLAPPSRAKQAHTTSLPTQQPVARLLPPCFCLLPCGCSICACPAAVGVKHLSQRRTLGPC